MTTTALVVEVLIVGGLALVWLGALVPLVAPFSFHNAAVALGFTSAELTGIVAIPALALSYVLGWTINFSSQRVLNPLFRKRLRERHFSKQRPYEQAAFVVYQHGSTELIRLLQLDRHVVRLARGATTNFALIAIVAIPYALRAPILFWCVAASGALAALSLLQWSIRYETYYAQVRRFSDLITEERNLGLIHRPQDMVEVNEE